MGMVDKGQLPVRVALETGSFPNSEKILAALDRFERQAQEVNAQQQAAMMQGITPQQPM
jgi:hypothetical protein